MTEISRRHITAREAQDCRISLATIKRDAITTNEAAWFCGMKPRKFARWARARGIEPYRVRVGKSFTNLWPVTSLFAGTRPS